MSPTKSAPTAVPMTLIRPLRHDDAPEVDGDERVEQVRLERTRRGQCRTRRQHHARDGREEAADDEAGREDAPVVDAREEGGADVAADRGRCSVPAPSRW